MSTAFLHAFGAYLPDRIVTNAEIAARLGRTPDWIENASGIRERRWAAPENSVADLAVAAAQDCLERAGIEASALGLVVFFLTGSSAGVFSASAGAAFSFGFSLVSCRAREIPAAANSRAQSTSKDCRMNTPCENYRDVKKPPGWILRELYARSV